MPKTAILPCPTHCGGYRRHTGDHLCGDCFLQLPEDTQDALNLNDSRATIRRADLLRQIRADVALSEITIASGYGSPPTALTGAVS